MPILNTTSNLSSGLLAFDECLYKVFHDATLYGDGTRQRPLRVVAGGLPTQAGHAGEFLTTDGTTASWTVNSAATLWGGITGTLSNQTDLQNELNLKANLASPTFTGTVVLPSTTSIGSITNTELSYVDGVTSSIQTQLDSKLSSASFVPAGVNTQIQFNNSGAFGASANLTWDGTSLMAQNIKLTGTAGAGYIWVDTQSSNPGTPPTGFTLFADSTGRLSWKGTNGFVRTFDGLGITANRVITIPDASGTIAYGTGTANQVAYWSATNTLTSTSAYTWNLSTLGLTGATLTGSSATSLVDLTQTWNTSGTPTAIKLNVTNTASNAASLLLDLQVGGVTQFSVARNGSSVIQTGVSIASGNIIFGSSNSITNTSGGGTGLEVVGNGSTARGLLVRNNNASNTNPIQEWRSNDNTTLWASVNNVGEFVMTPPTITGSAGGSAISIARTWNTTGTPTSILMNITDTASNAASLLMDLQKASVSQFKVTKNGQVQTPGGSESLPAYVFNSSVSNGTSTGMYSAGANTLAFSLAGGRQLLLTTGTTTFGVWSAGGPTTSHILQAAGGGAGNPDRAGISLQLESGQSTGNGTAGDFIFRSTPAGSSGSSVNAYSEVARIVGNGQLRLLGNSIVSTPMFTAVGTWFTGGTVTTTKPHILIEPTGTTSTGWSTSGTGLAVNSASGFTGNLIDLQKNGTSEFSVSHDGIPTAIQGKWKSGLGSADYFVALDTTAAVIFQAHRINGFNISAALTTFAGTTSSFPALKRNATSLEVKLADDSAYTLLTAGRLETVNNSAASTPAMTATGTWFTGGSSTTTKPHVLIETSGAVSTFWSTSGTGLGINAASGFIGRLIDMQVNGVSKYFLGADGNMVFSATAAIQWTGNGYIQPSSNGVWGFYSNSGTDFGRLQFGGTTSSFPSLKRSTTGLIVRLADDSADTDITAAKVISTNVVRLKGYTVATLPAGVVGDTAYASDLLGPTYLTAAVGGGAITGPVFYNGTAWVCS